MSDTENKNIEVIYTAYNELGKPNGPGVNELEFLLELDKKFKKKLAVCIVKPFVKLDLNSDCVEYVKQFKRCGMFGKLIEQYLLARKLRYLIKKNKDAFVVIRLGFIPVFLCFLSFVYDFKFVIKTGGVARPIKPDFLLARTAFFLLEKVNYVSAKYLYKKAKAIDCCTPELVATVVKEYGIDVSKVIEIPNATNVNRFDIECENGVEEGGINKQYPTVGYIGGSPSERGAAILISIYAKLAKIIPNLRVIIVGWDDKLEQLIDIVRENNLSECIKFYGSVDYFEIPNYMKKLDVGVAFDNFEKLSETGNSNQKVRQYLSSGIPVVTTKCGNEFISDEGLGSRVDHLNESEIVNSLAKWLSLNGEDRALFKHKARKYSVNHLSTECAMNERIKFWDKQNVLYKCDRE